MIEYYRTTPEPHWVSAASLEFGEALPAETRQRLKPGACDGFHPEYTEAFDIAGLRAAASLARALGAAADHDHWSELGNELLGRYHARFGADLRKHEYADYAVLWPCRLYPLDPHVEGETERSSGRPAQQFASLGAQKPTSWRYFPLARAHQGLLAGNRAASAETLAIHLDHEQMRGWYAFDEGGPSGPGNWMKLRSNWKVANDNGRLSATAMPHGWAIAEMHLLLRDALVFEDEERLVLFAGIPAVWFREAMSLRNLRTHFGPLSVAWVPEGSGGKITLSGEAAPPAGFVLRTPDRDVQIQRSPKSVKIELPR